MEGTFDVKELTSILEEEVVAHNEMVRTAGCINRAVLHREVDKVRSLTDAFDSLAEQVEVLEAKRQDIVRCFAREHFQSNAVLRIQTIIEAVGDPFRSRLAELGAALKKSVHNLMTINTSNKILLEENLKGVAMQFDLAARFRTKLNNYSHSGNLESATISRHFVNRTA